MDAAFRAQREDRKPCRAAECFRSPLVHREVAFRHAFGIGGAHAAEEGTHGKVPALHAMIEAGKQGEVSLVRPQCLDGLRQLVIHPRFGWEEGLRDKSEQVPDAHHASGTRCTRRLAGQHADGGVLRKDAATERFQQRQGHADAGGPQKMATGG